MKKWVKALGMSCLFCLLVVAGLFLFASRDIPPPDVSDLVPERPVIAPEKNGCTYFFTATESFYWPEDKTLVTGYLDGNPLDDAVIQDLLTRNAEAFRLIEKGVSCGVCLTPEVMTYDTQLPYLGPWRNLGRLLALKSRHERLAGDYASATGTCVLLLRFGNLLQKNAECFINYLVGISVLDLGLAQARELASDQTASPEDLKKLAEALAVIEPFDRSMIYAGKAEYKVAAASIDQIWQGSSALTGLAGSLPGGGTGSSCCECRYSRCEEHVPEFDSNRWDHRDPDGRHRPLDFHARGAGRGEHQDQLRSCHHGQHDLGLASRLLWLFWWRHRAHNGRNRQDLLHRSRHVRAQCLYSAPYVN